MVRAGADPSKFCFTLRQWAFLLGIIAFIVTAVLTFGLILGLRHTRDAWELVLNDLNEEECENENSINYNEQQQFKANEKLLHHSQHIVQVMIFLLDIGTIFGCLNQLACGLMVYGISTRSANCILVWIIISGITYVLVGSFLFISYFDLVSGISISFYHLVIAVFLSTIFLVTWYTMLLYYYVLHRPNCAVKRVGLITPTIMQAYGGYIHKIDEIPIEKKIIV